MTPFYTDDWLTLYGGDCRAILAELPSDSVDCVVTSPPYWGLRDYGSEGQLGLERTPEEYVANMVAVFAEVRRVLKPSGTCWLNLGDSYNGSSGSGGATPKQATNVGSFHDGGVRAAPGLKPKDLVGIPWRVAFALQADGWYLRSDIIWSKPNPMPESVTDRPTKSHEYLFLLTKSARYYFDNEAVREPVSPNWKHSAGAPMPEPGPHVLTDGSQGHQAKRVYDVAKGANIRSVWTIATRPYPGAHFAVFPPELPERCIKAGSSEKGVCPECGAPWERVTVRGEPVQHHWAPGTQDKAVAAKGKHGATSVINTGTIRPKETTGWRPTCKHGCECGKAEWNAKYGEITCGSCLGPAEVVDPPVILDPFGGSGTVGMVANRLSRRAILIDLNPAYLQQQLTRNAQTPLGLTEGDAA